MVRVLALMFLGSMMPRAVLSQPHAITQGFVGRCPKELYRTVEKCVFSCASPADVEEEVTFYPQSEQTVCQLPKGLVNLDVEMVSDGDVDTYILCVEPCSAGGLDQKEIIDWDSGLISDKANVMNKLQPAKIEHDGIIYSFHGDDRGTNSEGTKSVKENINATGEAGLPYDLYLHLKNNGLSKNHAWIRYRYDKVHHEDCGESQWIGCELCSNYGNCQVTEYPVCDGSNEVTCEMCDGAPCPFGATCDGRSYVCNGWWLPYLIGILGLIALIAILCCFCRHGQEQPKKSMRAVEMTKGEDDVELPPVAPAYTYYAVPTAPPQPMASVLWSAPAEIVTTRSYLVENQPLITPVVQPGSFTGIQKESPVATAPSTGSSPNPKPHGGHGALRHGSTTGHGLGLAVPE